MTAPPPLQRDQRTVDAEHLRILVICHYVGAGLSVVGFALLAMHYAMMKMMFSNPKMWESAKGGPPPEAIFDVFKWFYLVGVVFLMAYLVLNLLSAGCIKARRRRTFSIVVAGLNCLHMPLGTALGVFTMIVLLRNSVREVYES